MAPLTGRARRATGRGGYLRETLGMLWPEPARIDADGPGGAIPAPPGRPGRTGPDAGGVHRAAQRIPRGAAAAPAAAAGCGGRGAPLQGFRGGLPPVLLFRGLALAARAGLADLLPHRIAIEAAGTGPDTDVAAYLNAALGQDVVVSLRIGAARANRKPVLQLLAPVAGWWASPRSG